MHDRAMPGVQGLTPYAPGKPVEELERELGIRNIIKLASNENPLGASPLAHEAAIAAMAELSRYPDGNGHALRQALALKHDIEAKRIVLGNGSNDVLELVARAFLGPGRNAVFSDYAFAVYPIVTQAVGAELRVAEATSAESEMPLAHDLEAMLAHVDGDTGVVFIANPNNPTGTWLTAQAIEAFLQAVPDHVVVVLDEAYFEYMLPTLRCDSRALLERHSNLLVTRTFSKVYGLAALRVGYGLTSDSIADLLNRVRQPFNNNSAALAAAQASLADAEHINRSVAMNDAGKSQLEAGLLGLGLRVLPSQANFLAFDLGKPGQPVFDAMLHEGIILRPLASYRLVDYLRVTIGTHEENKRCIEALGRVLQAQAA